MNSWILSAARMIFVAWVADAHDDEESEFDAGDYAAGGGEDWCRTVPSPTEAPDLYSQPGVHLSWFDAWVSAVSHASQLYHAITAQRVAYRKLLDLPTFGPRAFYSDVWLACYHSDETDAEAHAHASASIALGHGVDDPGPLGGMPWANPGFSLDCVPNPLR